MERLTTDRIAMSQNWAGDERQKLAAILSAELAELGKQEVEFRQPGREQLGRITPNNQTQRQVAQLINLLTNGARTPAVLEASREQFSAFLA